MDQRPLMVWSRLWLAIATLPLLMIAAACGSSSPSTGNGPVADQQAVASNGCKLGNSSQVTGCQMADLDNAIDPAARAEYPQLLRQAAKACTMDPGSVAGMLLATRQQEQSGGASHTDSYKTLLHIVINDGPLGKDGCAGTLAAHVVSIIPH